MTSKSGKTVDLKKVALTFGPLSFRVDAWDVGGCSLAWQGDFSTVAQGADGIDVIVIVDSAYAIITINNMMSADVINYVSEWIRGRVTQTLSLDDGNGLTKLATATAMPRQRAGMTWSNSHTPTTIDIHCPGMTGNVGGLI